MKPYYQQDDITIYHGDCRDILPTFPDKSFDLVLTDPPYGIGEAAGKNQKRDGYGRARARDYGNDSWDDKRIDFLPRCLEKSKEAIVWGGNYYADLLEPSSGWLVWDKMEVETDMSTCELAWTSRNKGVRRFKWLWAGYWQKEKEKRFHPTQKPIALMKWCVGLVDIAESILDPFMGSGTTLVAAKQLGRKAVGIEIEEKYCEIAVKRLAQMELFSGMIEDKRRTK